MSLDVRGLTVRYGAIEAVSDVDLTLSNGEVLALLGPSGCGKSTLLRAIAGLEQPTASGIYWDREDLAGVPVHRREFGLVFQDGQLFPHHDVAGNIAFGPKMHGMNSRRQRELVAELLELVGLSGYEKRKINQLSGGEQQRVALARALAVRPRLLLLDEPLSALDRALRDQLAVELASLLDETKSTALVVTHDHDEAFTLADRVAVMMAGRIVQVDQPARVWRFPANLAVARFLGCETFLEAEVTGGVAHGALGQLECASVADGPVHLALHDDALRVATDGTVHAEVRRKVHQRDHARLWVTADNIGEVTAVSSVTRAPAIGDHVTLALDPDGVAIIGEVNAQPPT